MNPDYYKTNEEDIYNHELERINKMDDDQLIARYSKMKVAKKIEAFYEALVDQDRAPRVRKRIEKDGSVPPAKKAPYKDKGAPVYDLSGKEVKEEPMKFVKVFRDESDSTNGRILRQAIFTNGFRFFLYSYSKQPDNNVDETMVFRCDEDGDHDGRELFFGHGYIHSKDAMIGTQANIGKHLTTEIAEFATMTPNNYALEA